MIKKTTAMIAIILGIILFTAGSVYAAYNLHSTTTIEDNDLDSEYIVISSTVHKDFLDEVSFDTTVTADPVTGDESVAYVLNASEDIWNTATNGYGADGTKDACLISNATTINVKQTNVEGYYTLAVTVTDFIPIQGLTYTMKVGTSHCTFGQYVAEQWTFYDLTFGDNYEVALYVSGTPTEDPGATVGFTNYDNSDPEHVVTGSVFTFTATAPNGSP